LAVTTAALLLSVVAKVLPFDSSIWPAVQLKRTQGTKELISYQCPATGKGAVDVANNTHKVHKYQVQIREQFKNFPRFLETFRKNPYDQLAYSWEHAKKSNYDWKSRMYDVQDGDSVYESASGIGLNLYQTMEILHEVKGIESLVLYGNDYLDISVEKSNLLYDQAPPRGAIKGQFCQSDSKNLSFVPSNAFDLVYTGYIMCV
jgi:ubiquinone/menaquinone biosynthesis C-methylase UbiE